MGIHDGHRGRVKDQFRAMGLDGISEHNVLELLLLYAIPRGDVNPLAHRLIETFGSLSGVLDAGYDNLLRVPGVGPNTATLLTMIPQLCRRYLISRSGVGSILDTTAKAGEFLLPRFFGETNEVVYLLALDSKLKLLSCVRLESGSPDSVHISARKVAEAALALHASGVILAHNHVSGIALPSEEDIEVTHRLWDSLRRVEVQLIDHIIVTNDDFVSLRDNGSMRW